MNIEGNSTLKERYLIEIIIKQINKGKNSWYSIDVLINLLHKNNNPINKLTNKISIPKLILNIKLKPINVIKNVFLLKGDKR